MRALPRQTAAAPLRGLERPNALCRRFAPCRTLPPHAPLKDRPQRGARLSEPIRKNACPPARVSCHRKSCARVSLIEPLARSFSRVRLSKKLVITGGCDCAAGGRSHWDAPSYGGAGMLRGTHAGAIRLGR